MIELSLAEVAEITGGTVHDADPATRLSGAVFLDTRTPEPDGIFAAFAGEHVDGHDYAARALDAGAAAVLGSRPVGLPAVVVPDVRAALQALAAQVVRRLAADGLIVIAVTGSQGKTSTKDLLGHVLEVAGPTVATRGSFNNEIGLPITVLRATPATRYLVLEMGARGIGHLADLCAIAPPDISLVLNVGSAHLGEFGSQENIAQAKGEIVEALPPGGTAVLNADDPLVAAMAARSQAPVLSFGTAASADVRLSDVTTDDLERPGFTLTHDGDSVRVQLGLVGAHQASNAAAVAAVAIAAGVRLDEVQIALEGVRSLSPWRMEVHDRPDGLTVVNDAYNANPESMRAALETLAAMGRRSGRRTVAVLGVMRELGAAADVEHARLGRLTQELGIDTVVVVGEGAREIVSGRSDAYFAPSRDEATAWLRDNVAGPDVVLVKASRAGALEVLAQELLDERTDKDGEVEAGP